MLALQAYLLSHQSFQPSEQRVHLQGTEATWSFELASPQSLFLEFEYIVQSADDSAVGIVLRVNDTEVAAIQAQQLYVTQYAMLLVRVNVVRAGENRLHVKATGSTLATFEMNLRLHNSTTGSTRVFRARSSFPTMRCRTSFGNAQWAATCCDSARSIW